MNRREFLQAGAAVAATSGMTARSYAAIVGANSRVQLGIAGLGRRAVVVMRGGFTKDARVQVAGLSDVYDKQAQDFQKKFNLASVPVDVDYRRLIDRKNIDAVFIATPDHLHVQMAHDTLAAGKHTYLEKPTLHRWHERETLVKAAADHPKQVLMCGMQQRSGAHYKRIKQEYFDTGKLGDVVLVRAIWNNFSWQRRVIPNEPKPAGLNWDLFLGPAPKVPYETARYSSWRSYHDYGNGVLADILTHWVDVAQWMLNDDKPQQAAALGGDYQLHDGRDNPDTVSAIIKYGKWNLNFESSVLSIRDQKPPSVFFEGTEGTLDVTRGGFTFSPNKGEETTFKSGEDLEQAHVKNFIDAVTTGSSLNAPLSVGLAATVPVEMALASYWGKKIATPKDLDGTNV
ncbi:MAG: Gfo/Idh/MocA family oxidoreductase [Acidobacteria bacterium]|nr:Gfo/Idh/MocA family oxidoreductase [Acidobacteriota bacterium]